jgi:hypothetical protein
MVEPRKTKPDFFDDGALDPVEAATGPSSATKSHGLPKGRVRTASATAKKKAGFYLSEDILNRFNLKFYELKLAGAAIENKSNLLELMLGFALDDMDKGEESRILQSSNSG